MKNSVTIYTGDLTEFEKGELTPKAELELKKLLEARQLIDLLLDAVKDSFGEVMAKENTNLIERGNIKITRSVNGRKYNLDPEKPVSPQFIQSVSYQIPNSKEIQQYVDMEGTVPEGILEVARKQKIEIELIED